MQGTNKDVVKIRHNAQDIQVRLVGWKVFERSDGTEQILLVNVRPMLAQI